MLITKRGERIVYLRFNLNHLIMKKLIFIGVSFLFILNSCGPTEKDGSEEVNVENEVGEADLTEQLPDGFQLLQSTCFSCHNPNPASESVAPPNLAALKSVYFKNFPDEANFVDAMSAFLSNPSADKAILPGAVNQYGLMPQMSLQANQSRATALYLYANAVENEEWYTQVFPKEEARVLANRADLSYVDRGFEYAMATKSILGKNLKEKINAEGTLAAVQFCNINASHYTDSMSAVYNAEIKRVSDKPRNSRNQANTAELKIINDFKTQLANGEIITPQTIEEEDLVYGYYPIETNDMCLKCHGPIETMDNETHLKITELYPSDKATGYATNQLRGIWVVKMMK